jgi:hypothetical protein
MSFAAVVMFAEPGRARLDEWVSVRIPAKMNVISLPSQLFVLAIVVIVVVPVTEKTFAVDGGVTVAPDASVASETSCLMKAAY